MFRNQVNEKTNDKNDTNNSLYKYKELLQIGRDKLHR
jgi:hypothetical protein